MVHLRHIRSEILGELVVFLQLEHRTMPMIVYGAVEDLKKKVKDDLLSRKERENVDGKRSQITQKFIELPDFPLPQQAVEDEAKAIFQSNVQRAMQQGAKQEDMESKRDEMWKESQVQAQARVKITITLGRIAEIEKVEVTLLI